LLLIVTLHIFYVYLVCARLLHVNLKSLHSLFLLFRGQKWNVLRRRVDSADLQMDQLLIGCILFTITVCLFPTTLLFYVSYMLIWLLIFSTHSVLKMSLFLFLSFPTSLLLFRARAPHLLTAGVSFEPLTALKSETNCSSSSSSSSSSSGGGGSRRLQLQPHKQKTRGGRSGRGSVSAAKPGKAVEPAAAAAAAAAARSSSNVYFMLCARPITYADILWPPIAAAARSTLAPLHPSALLPKILQGDIVRLSRHNAAAAAAAAAATQH
ncbi:N-acetylglucosamine transferase, related, partial [Eimeria tenella]